MRISPTKFYKDPLLITAVIGLIFAAFAVARGELLQCFIGLGVAAIIFGFNLYLANRPASHIGADAVTSHRRLTRLLDNPALSPPKSCEDVVAAIRAAAGESEQAIADTVDHACQSFHQGQAEEAEIEFRRLTERFPNAAELHFNLGFVYLFENKPAQAVQEFRTALKLKPDPDSCNNLGLALADDHQIEEALAVFREGLQKYPDHIALHINLGGLLLDLGKPEQAERCFQDALKHDPRHFGVCYSLGNVFLEQRKFERAIQSYHDALADKPDHSMTHNNLGVAYMRQNRIDRALVSFEKAVQANPDNLEAQNNLGALCFGQGDLTRAITAFTEVLRIKPDCFEAQFRLGIACMVQGEKEEAVGHFQRFIEIAPPERHQQAAHARRLIRDCGGSAES